ncbi:Crp/Fnr family transcriptional regulator [Aurantimonas sp. VKM B-3413]|nr:Crp/Fnr family transcriptional regulator [Aurantimonas sp. VKM B-3413]
MPIDVPADDEAALTAAFSKRLFLRRKSTLVLEGRPSDQLLAIVDGVAYRAKMTADGARQIVGIVFSGGLCNLPILFFGSSDHSVETVIDCQVASAAKADILDLMQVRPMLATAFAALALANAASARNWVLNVGRRMARQRVARFLCEVMLASRLPGSVERCSFPFTQEIIADATGLSIVQVNRTLRELRAEGQITLESRVLTIHGWDRLCSDCEFPSSLLRRR